MFSAVTTSTMHFTMTKRTLIFPAILLVLLGQRLHAQETKPQAGTVTGKCLLSPTSDIRDKLQEMLLESVSLVYTNLHFQDTEVSTDVFHRLQRDLGLYQPWSWQRSTSRQGRSLLMLSDNYDVLSLTVLSIRVEHLDVTLTVSPEGCLSNMTSNDVLDALQTLLLNDFQTGEADDTTKGSLSEGEHVCHREIRGDADKYADFVYVCCHGDEEDQGHAVCTDVTRDPWVMTLLAAVLIIKILVVLYSPSFIPETVYRLKFSTLPYIYHLPPQEKVTLRMLVTDKPGIYGNKDRVVRLSRLPNLTELRKLVEKWPRERVHDVTVRHVQLAVKARKLLTENHVPVGLFKLIYNNLFLCRLRSLSPLKDCCRTSILGSLCSGLRVPTWFRCARALTRVLLLAIIVLPWIIRAVLYHVYDRPVVESKAQAAEEAGLRMPFTGSFTLYLTPLHVLFVICYVILCVDSVVYGVLAERVKQRLKQVLIRCLRDMKENSATSVCAWVTSVLVLPFALVGVLGFIILPLYLVLLLPLMLPVLAFYLFPAVNLSVRLCIHALIFMCPNRLARAIRRAWQRTFDRVTKHVALHNLTEDESFEPRSSFSKWELPFQVLVVLVCLVSFWSVTFLLMELLSFGVEIAVYTFIGLIITADVTSQYLGIIFFLLLYGHGCFSAIHKKYLEYHQVLHKQLLSKMREEIDRIARTVELDQENTALRVQGDMASPTDTLPVRLNVQNGQLHWATSSLLLFLDKQDTPYIPERFFQETIDLNYCGCPGKLYQNYLTALWKFIRIIVFLLFVLVVVMAFGSAYSVSTTNQLLATVAGGFIPFMFDHFFSSNDHGASMDPESVQFRAQFHAAINKYEQSWPVFDILPDKEDPKRAEHGTEIDENSRSQPKPPETPPVSTSSPFPSSTPFSSPANAGSLKSEKAESINWEDTSLDVIFDVSNIGRFGVRSKRGLSDYEAGSQTMLNQNGNDRDGAEDGGVAEGGGEAKRYRPAEPSLYESDEVLTV